MRTQGEKQYPGYKVPESILLWIKGNTRILLLLKWLSETDKIRKISVKHVEITIRTAISVNKKGCYL